MAGASSPPNAGDASLELLFHEASHSDAIEDRLRRMIKEESVRQKLDEPAGAPQSGARRTLGTRFTDARSIVSEEERRCVHGGSSVS